jgi:UDP-glucose 4-epimerase
LAGTLASVASRRDIAQRLFAPLQVDSSRIRRELGWSPPFVQREALASTARWFKAGCRAGS